ncbi:type VI secretion system protein TssA [Bremerella cremea]|uniref:Type VI secretion system protein TssA n=1 Tax=Blastopirellula marina TaxID=124 RepID=A0A2S8FVK1_9BACT|nr:MULTISPECIES: type VI secretion system protein TssA [Pirellulaceae]PQO36205.1 type VI secretion system protein TssA [Blastopirellula marina]RCS48882.1 type VI secretion system protein TssA [Bremerella cremea]
MAFAAALDVESLINPISEESPSGVELRQSEFADRFFDLREYFNQSNKAERDIQQAMAFPDEEFPDLKDPEWEEVRDRAIDILATHSKDVSVASWLIEAEMRLEGIAGLRDGFKVMLELCRRYWDNIHPAPDEDEGYAETVSQLTGLTSERTFSTLENIPLTNGAGGQYSLFDFNEANRIEGMSMEDKHRRVTQGAIERHTFDESFRATSRDHWNNVIEDLDTTIDTIRELATFLDERCVRNSYGEDTAPSMTSFRQKLETTRASVQQLMSELLLEEVTETEADENAAEGEATTASQPKAVVGTIQTRSDAIKMIRKVAEYFRKTEPQSFIHFKLEQAAQWAEMPFPELLKELLRDETAMGELSRRTGIPIPKDESDY